jgi:DNA repair protein SbcC/Rad50
MINKISIQNFQSHKNTELHFDKGVNVIIGSSDSGKTAIIRALRWLMWNKPGGDSFRSYWGGDTVVSAETDKTVISRSKGNSNLYEVDDTPFTGFGTNVPDEIQKVFNISEINLQQQLDTPFLLTESPGNVAKHFNKIAKLDKIDTATSELKRKINSINTTIRVKEEKLNSYQETLSTFPDLDLVEVKLEDIEDLEIKRNTLSKDISSLTRLIDNIKTVREKIEVVQSKLIYEDKINELIEAVNQREQKKQKANSLLSILNSIEDLEQEITEKEKVTGLGSKVNSLIELTGVKRTKLTAVNALTVLVGKVLTIETKLLKTQENVSVLEEKFHKEMGEVCVLCGSKLK